jgi:hypothetical protein
MSYRDRIIAILAMDQTDAFDLPRAAGDGRPPARRLNVGALKQRLGLAPTSNAPAEALATAAQLGFITRTVETEPTDEDATGFRTSVYIGPGQGIPLPIVLEERRERDAARHAAKKAQLADRMALLECAAQRAAQGCPSCGGALRPCEWACEDCATYQSVASLAGEAPATVEEATHEQRYTCQPNPTDSMGQIPDPNNPAECVGHVGATHPPCAGVADLADAHEAAGMFADDVPWDPASEEDWDRIFPPLAWPPGQVPRAGPGQIRQADQDGRMA